MAVSMAAAKNGSVIFSKVLKAFGKLGVVTANQGYTTIDGMKKRLWVSDGSTVPSGAAPTNMEIGDIIYHVATGNVYRYGGGTTYTCMTTVA